jgi:hypothetical protein
MYLFSSARGLDCFSTVDEKLDELSGKLLIIVTVLLLSPEDLHPDSSRLQTQGFSEEIGSWGLAQIDRR